jgi:hypothetical protein
MTQRKLLFLGTGIRVERLATALSSYSIELCHVSTKDNGVAPTVFDTTDPFDAVAFAPALNEPGDQGIEWLQQSITETFSKLQTAVSSFEERKVHGRFVSLLPVDATMGDPDHVLTSALCGAMISLFRTASLEFRGTGMTANTLMYSTGDHGEPADPEIIAALINTLLFTGSHSLNGQEIFATGATDVGRLHP